MTAGLLPQPGGFEGGRGVDLIADALPPARPNALQGLAHPVIDDGVLDNEHEQVAALQLNTESQGSHLRNRLLRLGATLWADPVLSLHPIHRSRLSLRPAFLRFLRHRLIPQSGGLEGLLTIHVVPLPHHHPTSHGDELKQGASRAILVCLACPVMRPAVSSLSPKSTTSSGSNLRSSHTSVTS
jgi:hypothetical protein